MKTPIQSFRSLVPLACLLGTLSLLQTAPVDAPVALVGEGYGWTEVQSITRHVLDAKLPQVIHEAFQGRLDPEEFNRFRAVVLAGSLETPYSPSESYQIEEWVRGGGTLVLIQQAPKNFFVDEAQSDRATSYLFGRSYYLRENPLSTVFYPDAAMIEGAFDETPFPFWLSGSVMLRGPQWINIAGNGEFVLIGHLPLDKGSAFYLGHFLFRVQINARRQHLEHEADGWVDILRNILGPNQEHNE